MPIMDTKFTSNSSAYTTMSSVANILHKE